jgi:methionyl-tRNA synthetase
MLREVPFGGDGDFSQRALIDRINSDLGNDLGNLLNRLIGMSGKYFDGRIESDQVAQRYGSELAEVEASLDKLEPLLFEMQLHRYLEELWRPLSVANKAIDTHKPWELMKAGKTDEAMALNGLIANILARVAIMLHPVMPKTTDTIASALGFAIGQASYEAYLQESKLLDPFTIEKTPPLFPRVEEPLLIEATAPEPKVEAKKTTEEVTEGVALITIDQFFQTELKIGTIVEAEKVPKSKKLLLLQVDVGEASPRQIVAGIKEWYSSDDLIGTQACVVANLKPAKLMGLRSEGMLLAAKDDSGLSLLRPEAPKQSGTKVS